MQLECARLQLDLNQRSAIAARLSCKLYQQRQQQKQLMSQFEQELQAVLGDNLTAQGPSVA